MCGIAGVLYTDHHRPVARAGLEAMGRALAHRGPDGEGYWQQPGIGLVHRRLSIIDLVGGTQPLGNEDGSLQVVFNGEIYNYPSLRAQLESRGHEFRTRSDTEVLVHLYEEDGDGLVDRLRGMFAFALWDTRRRRLLLARDRLGLKPLYLYADREKLVFASELKAILAYPEVRCDLDPAAIDDYLALGCIPQERSVFRQIRKLPPAHVLALRPEALDRSPRRYWSLEFQPDHGRSLAEWETAVETKIEESVRSHLLSDVPVGAFLSGGLDSSIIVSHVAGMQSVPLATFSIGFREARYSELPFAEEVARRFGCNQVEQVVTPEAVAGLDALTFHYDEPFADSSALPTLWLSRLAAQHVKVALSGDGGDEAFGGYARYAHDLAEARWRARLPAWFRKRALRRIAASWPAAGWLPRPLRAKTRLTNLSLEPAEAYANTLALCRLPFRRKLLAAEIAAGLNGPSAEERVAEQFRAAPSDDPLAGMLAADTAVLLPDDFLVKVDRASMAHGLEVRPPLVDHELLELAARMPSEYKVRKGETKWLLKRLYAERLPSCTTVRRKQGFDVPVDEWLRGPLREMFNDCVLEASSEIGALLDQRRIAQLAREHQTRQARHGKLMWALLVLARWGQEYLGHRPTFLKDQSTPAAAPLVGITA